MLAAGAPATARALGTPSRRKWENGHKIVEILISEKRSSHHHDPMAVDMKNAFLEIMKGADKRQIELKRGKKPAVDPKAAEPKVRESFSNLIFLNQGNERHWTFFLV